ncbi:MAG: MBL fold metallo-hydrolase [Actinobacteria bacterium]|nr:MBL fold metallo-hydrolase [Actinomycetota bacterium]
MKIDTFTDMSFGTNNYLVWDEETRKALLIDAGASALEIVEFLEKNKLKLEAVLLTHGHPDHTVDAKRIVEVTGADVYLHKADAEVAGAMPRELLEMMGFGDLSLPDDIKELVDGEELEIAGFKVKVLHTPGHSEGSVSFLIGDALFDGDLVFQGSIGRTDFPGGDFRKLLDSVRRKVFTLDSKTIIYPGHMGSTTVAREKLSNPFLTGI